MGFPAPISCHAWTQAATQFIYNSQQSSLIRTSICIFSKVHLHSQGFLFLFMLNSHTAKQSISRCALMSQSPWTQSQQSEPGAAVKIIFPGAFQLLHSLWIHWWESEAMPHLNSYPKFNFFFFNICLVWSTCQLYLTGGMYAVMEGELGVTWTCNLFAGLTQCLGTKFPYYVVVPYYVPFKLQRKAYWYTNGPDWNSTALRPRVALLTHVLPKLLVCR